ncbi:MAG: preprotein translocase subunit SecG [Sphaerochaetaceae bacterium]|nr:preprotein translocase subunit SecG [Sphaerochaetaceae bacterium]
MTVLSIILLILFVLVSLALIFLVAIQSEDNTGLGGVFGGNSDSAFGGNSNKVINRLTAYLVAAFVVLAVLVAVVNKSSENSILSSMKNTAGAVASETK